MSTDKFTAENLEVLLDDMASYIGKHSHVEAFKQLRAEHAEMRERIKYLEQTVLNAEVTFDTCSECEESIESCECERASERKLFEGSMG